MPRYFLKFTIFLFVFTILISTATYASADAPTITSISPASKVVGSSSFPLTVNGTSFNNFSQVQWNGLPRVPTIFISSTQIETIIPASDLLVPGVFNITVFNPTTGETSNSKTFTVTVNPTPTTTDISPASKVINSPSFTMTINGASFVLDSIVRFDGSNRSTTFISSTQLTASIPASDIDALGIFNIIVFNPYPGGGASNAQTFSVNNPLPSISGISPDQKTEGDPGFVITVDGSNFIASSVVQFDGSNRSTTFISSTQLTATILSSDLVNSGTFVITVSNPSPGGGTSNSKEFTVNNPAPTINSISPEIAIENSLPFNLTVNGLDFFEESDVYIYIESIYIDGSILPTTFLSENQLTTLLDPVPQEGSYNIAVFNPTPGGGLSNSVTFTVQSQINQPPYIDNFSISSNYCPFVPGIAAAYFSWHYNDFDNDRENQFQIQIDNNSNFSSPEIDRIFGSISYVSGQPNNQSVCIEPQGSVPGGMCPDYITFNDSFYIRVKIWQESYFNSGIPGSDSGWIYYDGTSNGTSISPGTSYATSAHSGPDVEFTYFPTDPAPADEIQFNNSSVCYDSSGNPTTCQSYSWDFTTGTSILQNPIHSYIVLGIYNVRLQTYDELGFCEINKYIYVSTRSSLPKHKNRSPFE